MRNPCYAWILALGLLLFGATAHAAPPTDLVTGVAGGLGMALDETQGHLYYVEVTAGTLKRFRLTPDCVAAPAPSCVDTVASGFVHPQSVALDADAGFGYVTTRDDPGTTGALWRVDLATGTRSLITFNLGAPQQVVVDPATNAAYTVGFDTGRLWRIDLATGAKVVLVQGLGHPVGLAVSADRTRAYVSEQDTGRVAEYELDTGARLREVATGLTAPFHLAWSDPAQLSLYLVERDPVSRLSRIDLVTATTVVLPIDPPGLPSQSSAVAFDLAAGAAYVTADAKVVRIALAGLPMGEPVFLAVGHVPATSITDGYATTDPSYFFHVTDAPFGGTLNLFGNLQNFRQQGATHYRVKVTRPDGTTASATPSWTAYRWNVAADEFQPVKVEPVTGTDLYEIPAEYGGPSPQPQRWSPPFLMLRWPSAENGLYTFRVEIVAPKGAGWKDLTSKLPAAKNNLTLLIDNTAPNVDLVAVRQLRPIPTPVPACGIVDDGPNQFDFVITAHDPNRHLLSYSLTAVWGKNGSALIDHKTYTPPADGSREWSGVLNQAVPAAGWSAACRCAHTFFLDAWKRTTNGYGPLLHGVSHQSLTINNIPACP